MWREDPPGFPNTASIKVGLHPSADRYIGPLPERSPRPDFDQRCNPTDSSPEAQIYRDFPAAGNFDESPKRN
jgi:hypothetical protein